MLVIGIVGGVASGKSLVARRLGELGAEVLDGDRAGHEVLCEPEVQQAVRRRWGEQVFDSQGQVDRKALAKIVFAPPSGGPEQLAYLEQITHPRIQEKLRQRIGQLDQGGTVRAVVLDAPVLLKAGWDDFCDKIIYVEAPQRLRLARARSRGWTKEDFTAREAAQESLNDKRNCADCVIDNSCSPEEAFAQADRFWRSLD